MLAEDTGRNIVRVAVPRPEDAAALPDIVQGSTVLRHCRLIFISTHTVRPEGH